MADFAIPLVVVILSILLTIALWWATYPFLLRFFIENTVDPGSPSNLQNGDNGANGADGSNAPARSSGSHGRPGAGSAAGAAGSGGRSGGPGATGPPGADGSPGGDGEDGDNGVPGIDPIFIRENIFDPTSKRIFYVNGVPINTHNKTVEEKKISAFQKDIQRLKERIQTAFKKVADKEYFTNTVDNIVRNPAMVSVDPLVLDTPKKANAFLDALKDVYVAAQDVFKTTKNAQTTIIQDAQTNLNALRTLRTADINQLGTTVFLDATRDACLDAIIPTTPDMPTIIMDIKTNPAVTIDSKIAELTVLRNTAQVNFDAASLAAKPGFKTTIEEKTIEINQLRNAKDHIKLTREGVDADILNAYKDGTDLSATPVFGLTLGDYSTNGGADALKAAINMAQIAIDNAIVTCTTTLDAFILPYKTANPP